MSVDCAFPIAAYVHVATLGLSPNIGTVVSSVGFGNLNSGFEMLSLFFRKKTPASK